MKKLTTSYTVAMSPDLSGPPLFKLPPELYRTICDYLSAPERQFLRFTCSHLYNRLLPPTITDLYEIEESPYNTKLYTTCKNCMLLLPDSAYKRWRNPRTGRIIDGPYCKTCGHKWLSLCRDRDWNYGKRYAAGEELREWRKSQGLPASWPGWKRDGDAEREDAFQPWTRTSYG